jgi:carboxyl-terminal processing protease
MDAASSGTIRRFALPRSSGYDEGRLFHSFRSQNRIARMPRRTLWLIFAVVVISLACYERADHNRYGRWFSQVLDTIDRYYLEPVDDQKLFEGALVGMVRRLDDYSDFLPRSETPQFQEALDQHYVGVGIEIGLEGPEQKLTVVNLRAGTPAYKSGLRRGDHIVSVDGRATEHLPLRDIVRSLRGKSGEAVALTVRRAGLDEPLDFRLVRALIKVDSVSGYQRNSDGTWDFFVPDKERIGYVRIDTFGESTVSEFEAAMKRLSAHKCRGVVIDMRNNPGGLLQAAERICDLFIPAGAVIVSTRGRDERERERYVASGKGPYQNLPLVVLVNGKSASASEIVAACLQDHHRATIVGQRTWGKGTIQNVIPLEGGQSLLKLTIASYWRPSGKNIHRSSTSREADEWGVKPDATCEVKLDEKQTAQWEDAVRQSGLQPTAAAARSDAAPAQDAADARLDHDLQLKRALEVLDEKLAPPAKVNAAQGVSENRRGLSRFCGGHHP